MSTKIPKNITFFLPDFATKILCKNSLFTFPWSHGKNLENFPAKLNPAICLEKHAKSEFLGSRK